MKPTRLLLSALTVLTAALNTQADVLELKNGQVLNGKFVGGTAATLRFDSGGGTQVIETSQIIALTFTSSGAPAAAPAPAPAPVAQPSSVTLPAGTMLLVRMADGVSSKNKAGTTFTTKLEYNLVADGVLVVPAGSVIYGKVQSSTQARRAFGKSTLDLRLAQVVVGGSPLPIVTSSFKQAGEASIKKAARGAAAGAAIGAIAGDAGQGAAIGATASLLKKGQTITVPPGALLEFTLSQPLSVRVAQ